MPQLDSQILGHIKDYDQIGSMKKIVDEKEEEINKKVEETNSKLKTEI